MPENNLGEIVWKDPDVEMLRKAVMTICKELDNFASESLLQPQDNARFITLSRSTKTIAAELDANQSVR